MRSTGWKGDAVKVAELIDELKQLDPSAEVVFRVLGMATAKHELTGQTGVYDLEIDVDTAAELDCIDNNGEVTLWI